MTPIRPISDEPLVTILMGVFQGAEFLPAQLHSLSCQSHRNWHLVCADDGSADGSRAILHQFAQAHRGRVTLVEGPRRGFAQNYLDLIERHAEGWTCFADQDDVWHPEKIARTLHHLRRRHGPALPRLSCGRQTYWYPRTGRQYPSPRLHRPCSFRNALIENVATGNTIMLNPAAAELARGAARAARGIYAHDWWLYLLITGCGGEVCFDNGPPLLLYRQHDGNAVGAGAGVIGALRRKAGVIGGLFQDRLAGNLAALAAVEPLLTDEARGLLCGFRAARAAPFGPRMRDLRALGLYRQRWAHTLGFLGAAGLGRV